MKKRILLLLFLLLLPIKFAMASSYGIERYLFNLTIEDNGDVIVEEYFEMNGSFNGMERIINFKNYDLDDLDPETEKLGGTSLNNADDMELLSIRAIPYNSTFDFSRIDGEEFTKVDSASPGDYGVYTVSETWYSEKYMIYLPSYKYKAFYIKYRLKNMAVVHNDLAELYYNIPIDELRESINDLKVTINIPGNKDVKTWAHGPLNGEVSIVDSTKVLATVTGVNNYTKMDVRVVFDKNVIKNSNKKSNIDALDKILAFEQEKADEANAERERFEKENEANAEEAIDKFEKKLTRYNYDNANYYVSLLREGDKKKELEARLEELHQKLIEKEEQEATHYVKLTEKIPVLSLFHKAQRKTNELVYSDTKVELLK